VTDDEDIISLKISGCGRLPEPARQKFDEVLSQYAKEVLDEASRLESQWRPDHDGESEITSRDVVDASRFARRSPSSKRSTRDRILDTVAFAAAFIGGVFGNNITTPVGAVGFAACALVGIIAYTNRSSE
jgi:hypothetical protein